MAVAIKNLQHNMKTTESHGFNPWLEEDLLEEAAMPVFCLETPWTEEPGDWSIVMKVGHD